MKYLLLTDLAINGVDNKAGSVIDLPCSIAQTYLVKGYVSEYKEKAKSKK